MKKLAINVLCAVAATLLAATAQAQFGYVTYFNNNQSNILFLGSQSFDGFGVDYALTDNTGSYTLGPLPVTTNTFDDYIGYQGTNGSLEIKSGTLTLNCDDFGVPHIDGHNENGFLTVDANATLNVNVAGQYYPSIGASTGGTGIVNLGTNAQLNFNVAGSVDQRWSLAENGGVGIMNINGGAVTVTLGTSRISDTTSQLIIGRGGESTGILNLNSGTFTDSMPLPVSLGGEYTGLPTGTIGSLPGYTGTFSFLYLTAPSAINISNGNFIVTGTYPPVALASHYPNNEAVFTIGNGFVNFLPGSSGALELTNWTQADFQNLVNQGQVLIGGLPAAWSDFVCTTNNHMGIMKLGPLVVTGPIISTPEYGFSTNDVLAGEAMSLIASVYDVNPGATFTYTWYSNNSQNQTFNLVPGATSSNLVLDTTALYNEFIGPYEFYVIVTDNHGNTITTAAVSVNSDQAASAPVIDPRNYPSSFDITPNGQPDNVGIGAGFFYSASFYGNLPMSLNWQFSTNDVVFSDISGATNGTLTFTNVTATNDGYYRLFASNSIGTSNSSVAHLVANATTGVKIFWETPVPMAGLSSDQILNSFAATDYVAAAMCCAPMAITVTNGDGSTIVFGALQSACTITGGLGSSFSTLINTNALGGNTTFSNLLNWNCWSGGSSINIISIPNLASGQQYIVELFSLDDANIGYIPSFTSWQDPTNASDISQSYRELPGDYIIGLLNASNTVELIQQNVENAPFNAMVVRTTGAIPPPYFIAGPTNIPPEYAGGNASFTGLAQEDTKLPAPTFSYQWISGPAGGPYTNLPANQPAKWNGVNTTNLTINNLGPSDGNLTYAVIASSSYGTSTDFTTIGTITPIPPPPPTNQPFPPSSTLIGQWLSGPASYAEQTGQYAGAHDAYDIKLTYTNAGTGGTNYWTNDVPPHAPAGAMALYCNNDGLFVTNSSTLDAAYASDYDTNIATWFTVTFWARGFPGEWNPWVSKYGPLEPGWQLRDDGSVSNGQTYACFSVENGGVGNVILGAAVYGNSDLMATRSIDSNDGHWHHYAGTFDSVAGVCSLYVDGVLAAQGTGFAPYFLASAEHLCIGAQDSPPGNSFGDWFTGKIFDVRLYDYALSGPQVAAVGRVTPTMTVATNHQTGQFTLSWPFGHLVTATNILGPWTSNAAAPPFTITTSPTNAQLYFRVENP